MIDDNCDGCRLYLINIDYNWYLYYDVILFY